MSTCGAMPVMLHPHLNMGRALGVVSASFPAMQLLQYLGMVYNLKNQQSLPPLRFSIHGRMSSEIKLQSQVVLRTVM